MSLQLLPRWITLQRDETPETVAFLSGAALATLDAVLRDPNGSLPCALLQDRMALDAGVACLKLEGRNESGSDIRDAVCLARAGDRLGPAGEMFMGWRKLARINLGVSGWKGRVENALPTALAHQAVSILGTLSGTPVGQARDILAELLPQFPREEAGALMLADVALARASGWERLCHYWGRIWRVGISARLRLGRVNLGFLYIVRLLLLATLPSVWRRT